MLTINTNIVNLYISPHYPNRLYSTLSIDNYTQWTRMGIEPGMRQQIVLLLQGGLVYTFI